MLMMMMMMMMMVVVVICVCVRFVVGRRIVRGSINAPRKNDTGGRKESKSNLRFQFPTVIERKFVKEMASVRLSPSVVLSAIFVYIGTRRPVEQKIRFGVGVSLWTSPTSFVCLFWANGVKCKFFIFGEKSYVWVECYWVCCLRWDLKKRKRSKTRYIHERTKAWYANKYFLSV